MDDEDYELVRPKPSDPPPLPRLWKDPPQPESAVEEAPPVKKTKRAGEDTKAEPRAEKPKKKKKPADEEVIDDGTGAIKLEATPVLDTYEARQRARWIGSGILASILLIGLIFGLRAFKNNSPIEEVRDPEASTDVRATGEARGELERQARIMIDMAKDLDKNGKTKLAVEQLNKLTESYTGTAAAREAKYALDRQKRDLTLFGEDAGPPQLIGPKPPPPGSGTAPGPALVNTTGASNANPGGAKNLAPATASPASASPPPLPATKPLPIGYRPNFNHPIDPSGWPKRILCDRDGAEMVLVLADKFVMGRDDGEPEEGPPHEVLVSTYYIDLHEVTVGQYLHFLKETGRSIATFKGIPEELPVVNVSYNAAKAYLEWAKRRLPTEAEWELAARGSEGRISYWNEQLPRPDPDKGDRRMEPVMSLKSDLSPYGAFDMAANAWEWTLDYFDSRYYKQFRNMVKDPKGPKEALARLAQASVRGGSKKGVLTWRDGLRVEIKHPYLGFRGALPAEGPLNPVAAPPPPNAAPVGASGVPPM